MWLFLLKWNCFCSFSSLCQIIHNGIWQCQAPEKSCPCHRCYNCRCVFIKHSGYNHQIGRGTLRLNGENGIMSACSRTYIVRRRGHVLGQGWSCTSKPTSCFKGQGVGELRAVLNRWHTVKSCIKAAAYDQLFNFLVRLPFKCGFYLRTAYMQSPESAKPAKAVWHM